jgi:hypothetical protein
MGRLPTRFWVLWTAVFLALMAGQSELDRRFGGPTSPGGRLVALLYLILVVTGLLLSRWGLRRRRRR